MSSSSDSEPDDNTKMLLASVDSTFYSDKMYSNKKRDSGDGKEISDDEKPTNLTKSDKLKSNRFVDESEAIFHSDINVSESMKKYVGKVPF